MQTRTNIALGVVLILGSLGVWWMGQATDEKASLLAERVELDNLPVLQTESPGVVNEHTKKVLFVYGPLECQPSKPLMDAWHALAEASDEVVAENVLVERGLVAARRYLSVYDTPYTTRLDSTAYLQSTLAIDRTPLVVIVSPDGSAMTRSPQHVNTFAREILPEEKYDAIDF